MPKFNSSQLRANAPHKVTVPLSIRNDAGEKEIVETDVFYRGLSLDDHVNFPSIENLVGQERMDAVKEQLACLVICIPDFGVGAGKEFDEKPDATFFGGLEDSNIDAISEAIRKDREVPTKPSNS